MANFSTNQVRQLFVLKSKAASMSALQSSKTPGDWFAEVRNGEIRVAVINAIGELVTSGEITKENFLNASFAQAGNLRKKLHRVKVTLSSDVLIDEDSNESTAKTVIGGQDYILDIVLNQYLSLSDEDQYIKHGMVHSSVGMSQASFYTKMAQSLVSNFCREAFVPVTIYLEVTTAGTPATITSKEVTKANYRTLGTASDSDAAKYTAIIIEAKEQPWTLGTIQDKCLSFDVFPKCVEVEEEEVIWGATQEDNKTVNSLGATGLTAMTVSTYANSKEIADLEYFCHGARGDQYRNVGFPFVINTAYSVNPTASNGYNVLNVHTAYVGNNESVQKSEKDWTFVIPAGSTAGSTADGGIIDLINAIETGLGIGDVIKTTAFTITLAAETNGTSVIAESASAGEVVTLTGTPEADNELKSVAIAGATVTVTVEDNVATFIMPAADITVTTVYGSI